MNTVDTPMDAAVKARRDAVRVPLNEPGGLLGRFLKWYSVRTYGDVPDNGLALLHNKPVLFATVSFERKVDKWDALDPDVFTETERLVLEYSEAMTVTPPTVTDEIVARLRAALGDPAVVELTMMVAVENERSRFNSALGLTSQGFSDRCELPR